MKNAIILHGKASHAKYFDITYPSPSNASWLPWIQKQLVMNKIPAQTPEMPVPWIPEYSAWSKEFERYDITPDTILVAHSCGAGFLVRWLSEHSDVRVSTVVLVAPWLDPDRSGGTGDLFDFSFDAQLVKRTNKIVIFNSDDDFAGAQTSAQMIRDAIPNINYREFEQYGHFTEIVEFHELRDEILSSS
jgi:predicted alpha/beta hydrolase family esterase